MVGNNILILVHNFYGNSLLCTLPFLEIFYKEFYLEIIGGIPENQSKIATHFYRRYFS